MEYASDIAFTESVKEVQSRLGSRSLYEKVERGPGWARELSTDLRGFVKQLDMFFFGTASSTAQPYIQYKGGAPGFLKILDDKTLAWAEFAGNKQYIGYGNLEDNSRAFIFLIDFATQKRVKLWGRARVVDGDAELLDRVRDQDYDGKAERVVVFELEAWDANCPQHIHRRFPQAKVAPLIDELQAKIAKLEDTSENRRPHE